MLICIDSDYFTAAVILRNDKVIRAAPILKYMKGWDKKRMWDYTQRKGWDCYVCEERKRNPNDK